MNTRSRVKRGQDAAPAASPAKRRRVPVRATGRTRRGQDDAEGREPEEVLGEGTGWSQESTDSTKPHWLGSRRGAPAPAERGTSEPPTPAKALNEDAGDDEDEEAGEENGPDASQDDDEIAALRHEVMRTSLPELASEAERLLNQLQSPQRGTTLYRELLNIRRKTFFITREPYEEPVGFPFIDGDQFDDFGQRTDRGASILGCTNLASALEIVETLQSETQEDILDRLEEVDDFFHRLFAPFGTHAPGVTLSLDIRTLRFIETLAKANSNVDYRAVITSIFCEPVEMGGQIDYPAVLAHGPHRALGHQEDDDVGRSLNGRIKHIVNIVKIAKNPKRKDAMDQLRKSFSREKILGELRDWILTTFNSQPSLTAKRVEDEFHDAAEQITREDTEPAADTQPIVRATDQQMTTLFTGAASLKALDGAGQHGIPAPPPNQEQQRRLQHTPSEAPSDYHADGNEDLIGTRPPTDRGSPHVTSPLARGDEEGDEDDELEKDDRPVDEGKAAAITRALQSTRTAPEPGPSSSMGPPPRPSLPTGAPSSSAPASSSHLDAIREEKRRLAQQHRAEAAASTPWPSKQRHFWTDHDTNLLIQLIRKREAGWSIIEREDNHLFERPRHQQAYRDKARNLKVDYLMTDAVLPPSFDLVNLGKKEINRLCSFGKNPFRREKDVEDGKAINTEFQMG